MVFEISNFDGLAVVPDLEILRPQSWDGIAVSVDDINLNELQRYADIDLDRLLKHILADCVPRCYRRESRPDEEKDRAAAFTSVLALIPLLAKP